MRLVPQRDSEPASVCGPVLGARLVTVTDVLGQVLGEAADAPAGALRSGQDALRIEPVAEPQHVPRTALFADRAECLVPGRQHFSHSRIEVVGAGLVPDRQAVAVVFDGLGGWPPDLVIVAASTSRSSARETVPRIAMCTSGARRRCGSTAAKYCTS